MNEYDQLWLWGRFSKGLCNKIEGSTIKLIVEIFLIKGVHFARPKARL